MNLLKLLTSNMKHLDLGLVVIVGIYLVFLLIAYHFVSRLYRMLYPKSTQKALKKKHSIWGKIIDIAIIIIKIIFLPLWFLHQCVLLVIYTTSGVAGRSGNGGHDSPEVKFIRHILSPIRHIYHIRRIRRLFLITLALVTIIGIFLLIFHPKSTQAAWLDDNWGYRQRIPIDTHTASETNVYNEISVDTATLTTDKLQADCDDLRFTKENGQMLPYQIVSGCDSATTIIRVGFDTMPVAPFNIYMYYGNPSSAAGQTTLAHAACGSGCAEGTFASEEKSPGPVGYWKFDDGTGTSAQDSTTNNNDGTITGATWQTDDLCVSGKCLYFTSTNNVSVSDPTNGSLDFGTGDFTISSWIRTGTSANNKWLIRKGAGAGLSGWRFGLLNGVPHVLIGDTATYTEGSLGSTSIADNKWHQLTVVYNRTGNAVGYVDGQQIGTLNISSVNLTVNNTSAIIFGNTYDTFTGFIDEPKIYNYARTANQIKLDYNSSKAGNATAKGANVLGANRDQVNQTLSNGLVGYWKMDESSGNAADSSGNGLTLTNNGVTTYVAGKFGNGSEYVPASLQYLSTATTISGVKSLSFWTNPDSTTNYFVSLTSGAYVTASSGVLSATGFTSPKIYVNGAATTTIVADSWQLVTVTTETGIDADTFYVGRQGSNYYDGTMDEVRTYNRTLSPAEVAQLYNFAPGPVGYWKFEEGSGTSANDSSSLGNTGTLTNNADWSQGKFGKGIVFDGTTDYVDMGNDSDLSFERTDAFTLGAWIKTGDTSADTIISKQAASTSYQGYHLWKNSATSLGFALVNNNATSNLINVTATTPTFTDNAWHYASVTYDGSSTAAGVKIYLDGILYTNTVVTDALSATIITTTTFRVGERGNNDFGFHGNIDQPIVYKYARTQKQVVEDMNAGHPTGGSPVGSTVGYWKLDEGQGATTYDSGSQKTNGTITGAVWKMEGKYGRSLFFDGTGDYVNLGDPASGSLDPTSALTISAWIKPASAGENGFGRVISRVASVDVYVENLSGSTLRFCAQTAGTTDTCTSNSINVNQWNHIAVVYTDGNTRNFYINGKLDATNDSTNSLTATSNSKYIGNWATAGFARTFHGLIDEVKVYNYALTSNEVKVDYNSNSAIVLGSLSDTSDLSGGSVASNSASAQYCIPGDTSTCNPPVGEWNFEEGSGTSAYDTSGNGHTGTFTGSPVWTSGKFGKALSFGGSDYVSADDSDDWNFGSGNLTVSFWMNPTSHGNYKGLVYQGETAGNQNLFSIEDKATGGIRWLIRNASGTLLDISTTQTIATNQWSFITAVRSGSTFKIYFNGVYTGTSGTSATAIDDFAYSLYFGQRVSTYYFNGKMDQIRIYKYARTDAQIAWEYNRGLPLLHLKFDECQGTTLNDSSGNQMHGTWGGSGGGSVTSVGTCSTSAATSWYNGRNGKMNYSLYFDRTDDYVSVSDNNMLDFTGPFSITTWLYIPTGSGNSEAEVVIKGTTDDCQNYSITLDSGRSVCAISSASCGWTGGVECDRSGGLSLDAWHHVAIVFDGTNIYIYKEGRLADKFPWSIGSTNSGVLAIAGMSGQPSLDFFGGQLDDFKIYNYALTNAQILTDFNQSSAVRFAPISGPP